MEIKTIKYHKRLKSKTWACVSGLYQGVYFNSYVLNDNGVRKLESFVLNPQDPQQAVLRDKLCSVNDIAIKTNFAPLHISILSKNDESFIVDSVDWDNLRR